MYLNELVEIDDQLERVADDEHGDDGDHHGCHGAVAAHARLHAAAAAAAPVAVGAAVAVVVSSSSGTRGRSPEQSERYSCL